MGEEGERTRGGPGSPGRRSRRAGRQKRTAVESPSINFHARIIIGKLESWLPDSRFVSPNESERVGAQRRAVADGGGSFRLYAASSKCSMLRRAIIIVSLASLPPRGRPAGQQTRMGRREQDSPLPRLARVLLLAAGCCPKAGAACKQWAAAGAAGSPSGCPIPRSGCPPACPPSLPTHV